MNSVSSKIYFILLWLPCQNQLGETYGGKNSPPDEQVGVTQRINSELVKPSGSQINTPLKLPRTVHTSGSNGMKLDRATAY